MSHHQIENKACPFCGNAPYLYKEVKSKDFVGDWKVEFEYIVRCPVCGATSHWHDSEDDAMAEFYFFGAE